MLVENVGVHVIILRHIGPFVFEILGDHDHLRANGEGGKAGHDECFAALAGGDDAIGIDFGGAIVVGKEERELGDIAIGAIGVSRTHRHALLGTLTFEHRLLGQNLHGDRLDHIGRIARRICGKPADDGVVFIAAFFHAVAAGVRHQARAFEHDQRFFRQGEIGTANRHFAGDAKVIAIGIVAKERKTKAIFAASSAVTGAGVAAGAKEDRHDIVLEADGPIFGSVFDFDGHAQRVSAVFDFELRLAICSRREHVALHLDEGGVLEGVLGLIGDIKRDAIGELGLHDNRLPIAQRGEAHIGGEDLDGDELTLGDGGMNP